MDLKDIQGNINDLDLSDRFEIAQRAGIDYCIACKAYDAEINEQNSSKAINLWGQIFGQEFPTYG